MSFAAILACHVLGAIGIGPVLTIPFLSRTPAALHAVLVLLRWGAGATLLSGILLWVVLKPDHALWLYLSSALFLAVIAAIGFVVAPAAEAVSEKPELRDRIRWGGIAAAALTFGIAILMVLRPSWA
jgi:F0F1-type ATP synthase membrane subunit c/vacuolar-type H+-ATPase subunit K